MELASPTDFSYRCVLRHIMGVLAFAAGIGAQAQTFGPPLIAPLVIGPQTIGEVVCSFTDRLNGSCTVTVAAAAPWCVTAGAVRIVPLSQVTAEEKPDDDKHLHKHRHAQKNPHSHDAKSERSNGAVRGYASSEREREYTRSGGKYSDDDDDSEYPHSPPSACAKQVRVPFILPLAQRCLGTADPYSLLLRGSAAPQQKGEQEWHDDDDKDDDKKRKERSTSRSSSSSSSSSSSGDKDDDDSNSPKPPKSAGVPRGSTAWLLRGILPCPAQDT
jgi:hypothetical protein